MFILETVFMVLGDATSLILFIWRNVYHYKCSSVNHHLSCSAEMYLPVRSPFTDVISLVMLIWQLTYVISRVMVIWRTSSLWSCSSDIRHLSSHSNLTYISLVTFIWHTSLLSSLWSRSSDIHLSCHLSGHVHLTFVISLVMFIWHRPSLVTLIWHVISLWSCSSDIGHFHLT